VKIRTALTSLPYRKVLKLNLPQLEDTTTGKIITWITEDVNKFDNLCFQYDLLVVRFSTIFDHLLCHNGSRLVGFSSFCHILHHHFDTESWSCLGQTIRNVFFSSYLSQNISLAKDQNFKENGSEILSYQRNVGRNNFNKMLPLGRQL
jgi:hypothetical protein